MSAAGEVAASRAGDEYPEHPQAWSDPEVRAMGQRLQKVFGDYRETPDSFEWLVWDSWRIVWSIRHGESVTEALVDCGRIAWPYPQQDLAEVLSGLGVAS